MPKIKRPGVFFALFLFLMVIMLTWFFAASSDYYDYTSGAIENTASIAPLNKESVLARQSLPPQPYDTEVKYRKFYLTVPGAQKVELAADFNRWGKDPIVLTPYKKGYFETSVSLASGEYRYAFLVDGKETPDPSNQDRQILPDGREVCVKTVR